MSNTLMQEAREIYERLIEIIAAGEFYWYAQASDYQGNTASARITTNPSKTLTTKKPN